MNFQEINDTASYFKDNLRSMGQIHGCGMDGFGCFYIPASVWTTGILVSCRTVGHLKTIAGLEIGA